VTHLTRQRLAVWLLVAALAVVGAASWVVGLRLTVPGVLGLSALTLLALAQTWRAAAARRS